MFVPLWSQHSKLEWLKPHRNNPLMLQIVFFIHGAKEKKRSHEKTINSTFYFFIWNPSFVEVTVMSEFLFMPLLITTYWISFWYIVFIPILLKKCSFFSLYLISPPCLLLCYRPVWLTGLRSAFSQCREDRLCSNWRYRNVIFQCCGPWFTLYFHLTYPVLSLSHCEGGHISFVLISHLRHSIIWKTCVKAALIKI